MDTKAAADILRNLAAGRDPATGEQFPPNSPYQQADTVRALYMALEALDAATRRARRQANRPDGAPERPIDPNRPKIGASWSPEEEQQLRDAFAAHKPIPELAAAHGRTLGAITARLVKLGLIEDSPSNRFGQGRMPEAGLSRRSPEVAKTDQGNRPPPTATESTPVSRPGPIDPDDCPF